MKWTIYFKDGKTIVCQGENAVHIISQLFDLGCDIKSVIGILQNVY
jgi:hypothetical protein